MQTLFLCTVIALLNPFIVQTSAGIGKLTLRDAPEGLQSMHKARDERQTKR